MKRSGCRDDETEARPDNARSLSFLRLVSRFAGDRSNFERKGYSHGSRRANVSEPTAEDTKNALLDCSNENDEKGTEDCFNGDPWEGNGAVELPRIPFG